jgi:hypothetical protein
MASTLHEHEYCDHTAVSNYSVDEAELEAVMAIAMGNHND